MIKTKHSILLVSVALSMILWGCTNKPKAGTEKDQDPVQASRSEHPRENHGAGEGEESGRQLTIYQEYNELRKGIHLVLSFDVEESAFMGTVENRSEQVMERVRVEVHLSNGVELGPTTQVDLKPGEKREINLFSGDNSFESWSTHVEVGNREHDHSHEGESEHDHSHN